MELQDKFSSHNSSVYSFFSQKSRKDFKFSLEINPRGTNDGNNESGVGIFLINNNSEKVGVSATFYLANQFRKTEFYKAMDAHSNWGYTSYITIKELIQNRAVCLPEGHLDIHCKFTFYIHEKKLPSEATTDVTLESLKDSMQRLLIDATLSDTTILCGEEKFHCHGSILANR